MTGTAADDEDLPIRVLVMTRQGCHLCVQAERVAAQGAAEHGVGWVALDVDDDPEWRAEFGDRVPVVLVIAQQVIAQQRVLAPSVGRARDVAALVDVATEVAHFQLSPTQLDSALLR